MYHIYCLLDKDKVHPEEQTIQLKSNAYFKCDSESIVSWKFEDGVLPLNVHLLKENSLYIEKIMEINGGFYECSGRTELNVSFIARGLLKALSK